MRVFRSYIWGWVSQFFIGKKILKYFSVLNPRFKIGYHSQLESWVYKKNSSFINQLYIELGLTFQSMSNPQPKLLEYLKCKQNFFKVEFSAYHLQKVAMSYNLTWRHFEFRQSAWNYAKKYVHELCKYQDMTETFL